MERMRRGVAMICVATLNISRGIMGFYTSRFGTWNWGVGSVFGLGLVFGWFGLHLDLDLSVCYWDVMDG